MSNKNKRALGLGWWGWCLGFISVAVIKKKKNALQKATQSRERFVWLTVPNYSPSSRGGQGRNSSHITATVKSWKKEMQPCLHARPLCPALFLHLCAAQDLENVTAHNGRVLPVSINNQVIALGCAHRPSLSGTFLIKTLSQVSPGCVKWTVRAKQHRWLSGQVLCCWSLRSWIRSWNPQLPKDFLWSAHSKCIHF